MNTESNSSNQIEVRSENLEPPSWASDLPALADSVLSHLGFSGRELTVLVCDTVRIRELNAAFRGVDAPTDVLSFPADEEPTEPYLGDIALSLPVIEEQATEFSVPFREEVLRMLVHGILHLIGHTHTTNDFASDPMLVLQEKIVQHVKETQL